MTFHWFLALDLVQHFWDFSAVLFACFLLFLDDGQHAALAARVAAAARPGPGAGPPGSLAPLAPGLRRDGHARRCARRAGPSPRHRVAAGAASWLVLGTGDSALVGDTVRRVPGRGVATGPRLATCALLLMVPPWRC